MTSEKRGEIVQELTVAYWMEMETVMNYVSNSINLEGTVPGSADFCSRQSMQQPSSDSTDLPSVIKGVIEAEESAIA